MWEVLSRILGSVVYYYGLFYLLHIIFKQKIDKWRLTIIIIIIAMIGTYIYIHFEDLLRFLLNLVFLLLGIVYITKQPLNKSVIATIIMVLLTIMSETIMVIIFFGILKFPEIWLVSNAGSIISNIMTTVIVVIFFMLLRKKIAETIEVLSVKLNTIVFIITAAFLMTMIIFRNVNMENDSIFVYGNVVLIIIFLVFVYMLISEKYYNYHIENEYDSLLKFLKIYEEALQETKTQAHEYKNQLITLKGIKNTKEKEQYIDSLLSGNINIKAKTFANFNLIKCDCIRGLLYYKFNYILDNDIVFTYHIDKNLTSKEFILNSDEQKYLCQILGVIIDNAIEEAKETQGKELIFEMYFDNKIIISVANSYRTNINKKNDKKLSEKGDGRGHGLLLVAKILKKDHNFKVEGELTERFYIQKILYEKNSD